MRQHAATIGETQNHRSPSDASERLPNHAPPIPTSLPPVPTFDLRIILFTFASGRLWVALQDADRPSRLPGGTPTPDRSLDAEAGRLGGQTTGLRAQYLEQLYTLGVPELPTWTVIVGYLGLTGSESDHPPAVIGGWYPIDCLPPLARVDQMMVDYAVIRLRAKLGYTTIAFHLLPPSFTIGELQGAYETIMSQRLDKRNFRRRVVAAGLLEPTGKQRRDGSHRPALLYRFRADADHASYLTPPWAEPSE